MFVLQIVTDVPPLPPIPQRPLNGGNGNGNGGNGGNGNGDGFGLLQNIQGLGNPPPRPQGQQPLHPPPPAGGNQPDLISSIRTLGGQPNPGQTPGTSQPYDGRSFMSLPSIVQTIAPIGYGYYAYMYSEVGGTLAQGFANAAKTAAMPRAFTAFGRVVPWAAAAFATFDVCRDWYRYNNMPLTGVPGSAEHTRCLEQRSKMQEAAVMNTACTFIGGCIGQFFIPIPGLGFAIGMGLGNLVASFAKGGSGGIGKFLFG